jgi:hypothetical protein
MNIVKLDNRYSGCRHWKYLVNCENTIKLVTVRNWCWKVWGASCEREFWQISPNANQHWAWSCNDDYRRIYLKTDTELSVYLLQFS